MACSREDLHLLIDARAGRTKKDPGAKAPGSIHWGIQPSTPYGALQCFTGWSRALRPPVGPAECPLLPSCVPPRGSEAAGADSRSPRAFPTRRSPGDRSHRRRQPPLSSGGRFLCLKDDPHPGALSREKMSPKKGTLTRRRPDTTRPDVTGQEQAGSDRQAGHNESYRTSGMRRANGSVRKRETRRRTRVSR
jgi:hypothetical protein